MQALALANNNQEKLTAVGIVADFGKAKSECSGDQLMAEVVGLRAELEEFIKHETVSGVIIECKVLERNTNYSLRNGKASFSLRHSD